MPIHLPNSSWSLSVQAMIHWMDVWCGCLYSAKGSSHGGELKTDADWAGQTILMSQALPTTNAYW